MRFDIRAVADEQVLPRVLEHLVLRALLLSRIIAELFGGWIDIVLEVPELDPAMAQLIVEKMRSSVLVEEAVLSHLSTHSIDGVTL
ncbi:hypothetical protein [Sphingobium sp.]|uniref:hypothetical protein n=1 Tax=Sphingobium sp. TaxID=1912891 RepID=UPI0028BF0BF5|nr:hypothetical protein [Sphingobium sp.]